MLVLLDVVASRRMLPWVVCASTTTRGSAPKAQSLGNNVRHLTQESEDVLSFHFSQVQPNCRADMLVVRVSKAFEAVFENNARIKIEVFHISSQYCYGSTLIPIKATHESRENRPRKDICCTIVAGNCKCSSIIYRAHFSKEKVLAN